MKPAYWATLIASALLFSPGPAFSDPAESRSILSDYTLTSWGQKDGLPGGVVYDVAQDSDGYLWLGTETGPFLFDGVKFWPWRSAGGPSLPSAIVRAVHVSKDGSVWLGFDEPGGLSRIRDNVVRNFGTSDGLGAGVVTALVEGPDGVIWAGTRAGLFSLSGDAWTAAGDGLPRGAVYDLHLDQSGRIFAATAVGLYVRDRGETSFRLVESAGHPVRSIAESNIGTVWAADAATGFRVMHSDGTWRAPHETADGSRLLYDSHGGLWVGTYGQGVWHIPSSSSTTVTIEKTTTLAGLTADGVMALLEDREGNVWVATNDGLNRFTPHQVAPVVNLGVINGVEATRDGSVWVGTIDALLEFSEGAMEPRRESRDFQGAPPSAMHAAIDGSLWVATSREVLRFANRQWSSVPMIMKHSETLPLITSIASNASGDVWLYDGEQGLFRWKDGQLAPITLPPELQHADVLRTLTDANGSLWMSFGDGHVAELGGSGAIRVRLQPSDTGGKVFRAMYADETGVLWLGSTNGVGRLSNGQFQLLDRQNGFPAGAVISIVEDHDHALWFALEGSGVIRVDRRELEQAFNQPTRQVRFTWFDKFDGFAGSPRWSGNRNSTAAQSRDGRLWFISRRGVSIIDPTAVRERPATQTSVRIDKVLASGQEVVAASAAFSLPQHERLEFQYSKPTLTYPLRTQFRYRLDGFDSDWVLADLERQATYGNLPPGHYTFRVVARQRDGAWPDAGAALEFSILPKFYQTNWFRAASVLGLLAIVAAIWRLHLLGVRKHFTALLAERARVSREIHDTVLQGLCGIGLQCDIMAHDPRVTAPAIRERLIRLRHLSEGYARETRRSILDLRSPTFERCDLADVLRQSGEPFAEGSNICFDVSVTGTPFEGSAAANEHLVRIAREALANSVQHGHATEVHMHLLYGDTSLRLRVSDNGQGFVPERVQELNGHYGLTSMRERAEAVGGTLTITSVPGRGTDVEAVVPKHTPV